MKDVKEKLLHRLIMMSRIFELLPIEQSKIYVESYGGKGYGDNARAIVDEIKKQGLNVEIYWGIKDTKDKNMPTWIRSINIYSMRAAYHSATAAVWIDNQRKNMYVHKRAAQQYIQTWHGFPLKKIEGDAEDKLSVKYIRAAKNDSAMCNLMVSNSQFLTRLYRDSFWYNGEVLTKGSPRNDVIISGHDNNVRSSAIRKLFGINRDEKIILYAPTFRHDHSLEHYNIDYSSLIGALGKRFGGKWAALIKLHPNITTKPDLSPHSGCHVVDVSSYPDAQDLYLAADVLITDYSSVMFDFMFTGKPCFLFADDINDYMVDRGFYYPIESLPFPLAERNNLLLKNIAMFDPKEYSKNCDVFKDKYGIIETGESAKAVVAWMQEKNNWRTSS